ncbi:amino acid transporter heavy chain SLC3A1-like [Lytechinus pictus]|uniref:amino acid transporter heavy chain SLC3A1-like n=1 Tax=Lytechinus pictus TaxID=7653 RepID=UPI00240E8FCE|nr:neutral and basic amino acid transport protein rBAT-like [Lytechinus pictus]
MENNGFDTLEMKETSKKMEAGEGVSEVNEVERGTPSRPQLSSRPYAGMGKEELLKFSQTPGWRAARWICLLIILAGWCAMLGMAIYLIITTPRCLPWWQSAVVYQIFPRSFADSAAAEDPVEGDIGGDGIGDLQGIIDNVGYLKEIGVNAVLLSSIYKSGGWDNGEDIVDFTMVDEQLGSIDVFENLVQELHDNDIKLILDFIPNHSSVEHDFFKKSEKVVSGDSEVDTDFQNYYTWADGRQGDLPSNWISLYSGNAWNCSGVDEICFLHQYSDRQPDLNLNWPDVRTHLTNALETWFTRGVDGFNIRGVRYFYEVKDVSDEPENTAYLPIGSDNVQYDSLRHDYTAEYDGLSHSLLHSWRDGVFYKFSTAGTYRVMLTDSESNTSYVQSYYGTSDEEEANLPMNFNLLKMGDPMGQGGEITGRELEDLIRDWLTKMDDSNWPNFQLGNYGASRIASRLRPLYSKAVNILLLTLPGTPICYYGDEIGMENLRDLEFDQVKDRRGLDDPSVWQLKTRDYERSPMQWDATTNAGFSSASEDDLYLPVHFNYQQVNVKAQMGDENSVLEVFRRLVALRGDYRALTTNTIKFVASSNEVISYIREKDSEKERFFIALNFGNADSEVDYYHTGDGVSLPLQGLVKIATDHRREGSRVELNKLHLTPGEGVVVLLDEIVNVGSGWWYKFFTPDA